MVVVKGVCLGFSEERESRPFFLRVMGVWRGFTSVFGDKRGVPYFLWYVKFSKNDGFWSASMSWCRVNVGFKYHKGTRLDHS